CHASFSATSTSLPPVLFLLSRPPPRSPLFPYTTLFRSRRTSSRRRACAARASRRWSVPPAPCGRPCGRSRRESPTGRPAGSTARSEEHTSELQSRENLVCRLLLEKKKRR